jgi:excinuclease ABC subunit B
VEESLSAHKDTSKKAYAFLNESGVDIDLNETIREIEQEMLTAANNLEFEKAALLRDQVRELKRALDGQPVKGAKPVSYLTPKQKRAAKVPGKGASKVSDPF